MTPEFTVTFLHGSHAPSVHSLGAATWEVVGTFYCGFYRTFGLLALMASAPQEEICASCAWPASVKGR